jgi:hypothetical protein
VFRGRGGAGGSARFVGFNRRGPFVWFTTCAVVAANPGEEFTFDVTTFGMPVSRWSYRLAAVPGGHRGDRKLAGPAQPGCLRFGPGVTGRVANNRPAANP